MQVTLVVLWLILRDISLATHVNIKVKQDFGECQLDSNVVQLSRDHKPEIPHEKERIMKHGGRVEKYSENGVKYGPFRVWVKNEPFPGLAMSRSIGDLCATSVGVTPEPGI